jgi:hypothetical protein
MLKMNYLNVKGWNTMLKMVYFVAVFLVTTAMSDVLLKKIKDETVKCDYLVVCPETMVKPAIKLAEHRNAFTGDGVENAHVISLEDIVVEFTGTDFRKRNETLWYAVKWAKEHWKDTLQYLVLVGDDESRIDTTDGSAYSIGVMPTWYSKARVDQSEPIWFPDISDDLYCSLSINEPPSGLSYYDPSDLFIGRIPAQNVALCSVYVEKVKRYDLSMENRAWKNKVIAIADDNYQGDYIDPISLMAPHQETCDRILSLCNGYFTRKIYLSAYPSDFYKTKPEAKKAIFSQFNEGAGFSFFFGHGSRNLLTDEEVLLASDYDRFTNNSMPVIHFSFTASNGAFLAECGQTMCKRYLFKEYGGCIAYVGAQTGTYANSNEKLGALLFGKLSSKPEIAIGQLLLEAKRELKNTANCTYFLLGDPALQCFRKSITVNSSLLPDTGSPSFLRLSLHDSTIVKNGINFSVEFSYVDTVQPIAPKDLKFGRDSVISIKNGTLNNSIDIAIPASAKKLKAVAFVWNDDYDGRTEIQIVKETSSSVSHYLKKISGRGCDIVVKNNLLTIINSGVSGFRAGELKIFDLKGRLLEKLTVSYNQTPVNLGTLLKTSGRYFLLFNSGDIQIRKSFMVLK